jgi:hypothetical protein
MTRLPFRIDLAEIQPDWGWRRRSCSVGPAKTVCLVSEYSLGGVSCGTATASNEPELQQLDGRHKVGPMQMRSGN